MSQPKYREFRADEVEFQYNPRVSVSNYPELAKKRSAASRQVRSSARASLDVPYGTSSRQTVDIYPADKSGGPVLVYYHGGYWRGGSKEENCSFVPAFVNEGINVVVVEYDICPTVTVTDIVRQARTSLAWIYRNIERFGGDPSRLYISGHSAGAHLGAMILAHDWQSEGLPQKAIKGAVLTSGVYDLDMVMHVSVNDEIGMTPELAKENSPYRHPPLPLCPVVIGVGGDEPSGWRRMSEEFFQFLRDRGVDAGYLVIAGTNHFTLPEHMADRNSPLAQAVLSQIAR